MIIAADPHDYLTFKIQILFNAKFLYPIMIEHLSEAWGTQLCKKDLKSLILFFHPFFLNLKNDLSMHIGKISFFLVTYMIYICLWIYFPEGFFDRFFMWKVANKTSGRT